MTDEFERPSEGCKYFVVCRPTHDALGRAVHYYMSLPRPYKPVGGVAVAPRADHSGTWCYQAMVADHQPNKEG